ncbi:MULTISPECIES: chemotaxis protein CheW [Chloroflexus]|jgi:purine-binding chemotaxis protein CheW|uniref:CheW protein n=1 Tax=Chloroflexus aggregans (strain MD-66 / DSM 9485) TaxID=326427 RepID=B8G3A8_CHLAD|nr:MULTISPECIES: chemotaxis protein CheW [Chloroflexus]ACL25281.1 CheW protein [Chloroflexus aggregans DSM 9485]RMD79289.1 MAG: purine-binding chemotaxis protein CheW [Chloroflexota bacterium]GIV88445.1 MAG: chemotaxis protein CheW [Chloroflexus sp.]
MQPSTQTVSYKEYLLFRLTNELYALPGKAVREVMRWHTPTPIPGAPPLLPGLLNQRGQILPVIDLRLLLGLPATAPDRATRLIWVHQDDIDAALLADAVDDLIAIEPSLLEPPPAHLTGPAQRVIHAVFRYQEQPVALLDPAAVFAFVKEAA